MKFQKSVDLGGIYFAKVELTLKFDQNSGKLNFQSKFYPRSSQGGIYSGKSSEWNLL